MISEGDIVGLGLESSCDETAASVVRNGREVLSNRIFSQVDLHKEYFGVVPEIASRSHLETINGLINSALRDAGIGFDRIDYVAATNRPGLVGSLLIALQSAKAISYVCGIPLIGVNHLEAHLYAPFLEGHELRYPYLALLISGGNTVLYLVNGLNDMEILGKTMDDAVGEAFDKVAKFLDLGYPGGPLIERLARESDCRKCFFPRLLTKTDDHRFSYSGLKTAVVNYVRNNPDASKKDIAFCFQERALELLVRRLCSAIRKTGIREVVVAGGVAANGRLREMLAGSLPEDAILRIPSPLLCTDNAAMVAGIGFHYFKQGQVDDLTIDVHARVVDRK